MKTAEKNVQVNPLNQDKKGFQGNLSIKRKKIGNESLEYRQMRLAKQRKYQKEKTANEFVECREKRLANKREYQKEKIANESVECREKRLLRQREYRQSTSTNLTVTDEIEKFHAVVSRGPLYICSCCDQLWYRQCCCC